MANALMPAGKPRFTDVIMYPTIASLVQQEGKKRLLAVLVLMVKDFCSSMNVVRNMTEDQMLETGAMLLEECDNFRMEDYLVMFTMAKKGDFYPEVKILDRIDIQVISQIMDAYWLRRKRAGQELMEGETKRLDAIGDTRKSIEYLKPGEKEMVEGFDKLTSAMEGLRANFTRPVMDESEALKDIHQPKESYSYGKDEKTGQSGFIKQVNDEKS